ncbi:MAG TPA: EamA family transporter [Candidatus Paceibacterota bacterium]|nr:EamA family transporter [Candidatus Paceibacterota bacterium]
MNTWFWIALSAPALWAVTNHIDGFVISRYSAGKRVASLLVFTGLVSGLAAVLISIFAKVETIALWQELLGIFAGCLFVGGYIPYMQALKEDEVSIAAPLWQMVVPLSYILGAIFLKEHLSGHQILATLIVIAGAVLMSMNPHGFRWKPRIFFLMLFASFLIALNTIVFKFIGLESSFWTISFWEYLGAFVFGLGLLVITPVRTDFLTFVREGGRTIVSLSTLSEAINVVARLLFNYAALIAPIALVYAVNGAQPFFIFLYALIIFAFFPKIKAEDFSRRSFILKIVATIILIAGSTLLFLS